MYNYSTHIMQTFIHAFMTGSTRVVGIKTVIYKDMHQYAHLSYKSTFSMLIYLHRYVRS